MFLSGTSRAAASPSETQAKLAPFFVINGGWNSCTVDSQGQPSAFYDNFGGQGTLLVNDLTAHFSAPGFNWRSMQDSGIRWLFSCFDKMGNLYFQANSDAQIQLGSVYDLGPLINRIERLSNDYERPVFFVGHSHGGWLAMNLVAALRQPLRDGLLATIDPISYVECGPSTYAQAAALTVVLPAAAWARLAPCRRAPQDLSSSTLARIIDHLPAESWKHYYQTNFLPLHSDVLAGPTTTMDMSPFFNGNGIASAWNAHSRIASFSSIWYGLRTTVLLTYGEETKAQSTLAHY